MEYQLTILDNGLTVVTEEVPYVRSASVGVWVGSGSRYEEPDENGISHFLEHIVFKGTESRTAREIAEAVDSVGAQLNAFTGKEHTCFYFKTLDEHLGTCWEVLSDMLLKPRFDPADIEREKKVIIEEIRMYEDTPDELVHEVFNRLLWPAHPLGMTILGTVESVGALTRDSIVKKYEDYFCPDNMVVSAAGNLHHEAFVEMVQSTFGSLTRKSVEKPVKEPVLGSNRLVIEKDAEQLHICLGGGGVPEGDPRRHAMHLLNIILGGGNSSRLFQKVREDFGLAYSVYSYFNAYRDTGSFVIYAGLNLSNAGKVVELLEGEIEDICNNGVGKKELSIAVEQLKGSFIMGLESTTSRMIRLGQGQLSIGRVDPVDEVFRKLESVESQDVASLAREVFRGSWVLSAVGPRGSKKALGECR